jgi:hypothetical protein
MVKFILGVVVGAVVATIGFTGVVHYTEKAAALADTGIHKAVKIAKDVTK